MRIKSVAAVARLAAPCLTCFVHAHAEMASIDSTRTGLFSGWLR